MKTESIVLAEGQSPSLRSQTRPYIFSLNLGKNGADAHEKIQSIPGLGKIGLGRRGALMIAFPTVNKQLADKERIAAALENTQLLEVVNQCLSGIDE